MASEGIYARQSPNFDVSDSLEETTENTRASAFLLVRIVHDSNVLYEPALCD